MLPVKHNIISYSVIDTNIFLLVVDVSSLLMLSQNYHNTSLTKQMIIG